MHIHTCKVYSCTYIQKPETNTMIIVYKITKLICIYIHVKYIHVHIYKKKNEESTEGRDLASSINQLPWVLACALLLATKRSLRTFSPPSASKVLSWCCQ